MTSTNIFGGRQRKGIGPIHMGKTLLQTLTLKSSRAIASLLLVVVFAAFTIPFIREKREQYVFERTLAVVEDTLNYAQTLAISRQARVLLHVSADQKHFQIEIDQKIEPLSSFSQGAHLDILPPEFTLNSQLPVEFNPQGYVTPAEAPLYKFPSLELRFKDKMIRKITIYPSGALSIE